MSAHLSQTIDHLREDIDKVDEPQFKAMFKTAAEVLGGLVTALALRAKERARLEATMIRELKSGGYRLYSRKKDAKTGRRRNLGTFKTRTAAEKHERAVQYFKRA